MDKKTEGVEIFVKEVLASIPPPYGEDIILRVFQAIEKNTEWERSYHSLSNDVGDGWSNEVINTWIGKYVKDQTGLNTLREVLVAEGQSKLIKSYSKLGR